MRLLHGLDNGPKRISDLAREAEAEDGVHDVVCALQRGGEVTRERHVEVLQLGHQTLVELVLGGLRVADGGLVAAVEEMSGRDEAVPTVVAGAAHHEHVLPSAWGVDFIDGLRDREAGELHQLVDGEGAGAHEVFVQCCGVGGAEGFEYHFKHWLGSLVWDRGRRSEEDYGQLLNGKDPHVILQGLALRRSTHVDVAAATYVAPAAAAFSESRLAARG